MSHIFISYARKDIDYAGEIVDSLAENRLDTWIDWKSIPKGEDWEQEIYHGIEEADAFLFLISPESVKSEMCNKEIAHAVRNGKRILPIFISSAEVGEVNKGFREVKSREEMSRRNYLFCREGVDDFTKAIEEIRKTIHTDYEWLKYHTKLQIKALDWQRRKDHSRLVRGKELQEAEQQLATSSLKDPQPTDVQRQYVLASRKEEARRQRQTTIGVTIGFIAVSVFCVAAIVASVVAVGQRNVAAWFKPSTSKIVGTWEFIFVEKTGPTADDPTKFYWVVVATRSAKIIAQFPRGSPLQARKIQPNGDDVARASSRKR
jgi:hypothetical protein